MRRLMGQTESKLHEKGEGNGEQCRSPESFCVGSGPEKGERQNDLPYRQNSIQCSRDGVLVGVGLADEVSLCYRLAKDEPIGMERGCGCFVHWDRSGIRNSPSSDRGWSNGTKYTHSCLRPAKEI